MSDSKEDPTATEDLCVDVAWETDTATALTAPVETNAFVYMWQACETEWPSHAYAAAWVRACKTAVYKLLSTVNAITAPLLLRIGINGHSESSVCAVLNDLFSECARDLAKYGAPTFSVWPNEKVVAHFPPPMSQATLLSSLSPVVRGVCTQLLTHVQNSARLVATAEVTGVLYTLLTTRHTMSDFERPTPFVPQILLELLAMVCQTDGVEAYAEFACDSVNVYLIPKSAVPTEYRAPRLYNAGLSDETGLQWLKLEVDDETGLCSYS